MLLVVGAVCVVMALDLTSLQSLRGFAVSVDDVVKPGVKYRIVDAFLEEHGVKSLRFVTGVAGKYPYGKWFIVVDGVPVVVDEATQCGCVPCRCDGDDCRWRLSPEQRRSWTNALEGISDGMPPKPKE